MAFIIYALPRSRSAWLAHFLNYPLSFPPQPVGHCISSNCETVDEFVQAYTRGGLFGTVEIDGIVAWQVVKERLPHLKTVVIRRSIQEVYASITKLGLPPHLATLAELNELLNIIGSQSGVYSLNSDDLDAPTACKWLFEYCLELEFDFDWWSSLTMMNIQVKTDNIMDTKPEFDKRYTAFKQDVLEQMKEIKNCLN
jgi:hypothetical protein